MTAEIKSQRGFTIAELLRKENMVLETGYKDDFDDDEDDDEVFGFSRNRKITNEEMLKYLNIEDGTENGDIDNTEDDSAKIVPCGVSFQTLKETMIDISDDGKIFKSIKRPGIGELVPKDALVSIHYMGYLEYQDEPFDSSYLRQSCLRVRLNRGQLISGLDIGISTMKKNEIAHFIIHPDYAYGTLGCPPRLPPNEEVMFGVCLIEYLDNAAADTDENLDQEERKSLSKSFPRAMAIHVTANDDFKRKRTQQAVKGYKRVIEILDRIQLENEEEQTIQQKARTKALINLGVCYNKLKEPRKTCMAFNSIPVPNAKAHFMHGKALMMMNEYDKAMHEFHKAKRLEPNNHEIIKQIRELNERIRKYKAEEKQLWAKCINVKKGEQKESEYDQVAKKICEKLRDNPDLILQNLPSGLDDRELDCFKKQAAFLGLKFDSRERYGITEFYISKPSCERQSRPQKC